MSTETASQALFDGTPLTGTEVEALYAVAYSFLDMERLASALHAFRVMVRFAPTDERAWLGLGACHEGFGQEDIALELYGAGSLVSEPPSSRCLIALARVLREGGDHAAACEHVERALTICDETHDHAFARQINQDWGLR